MHDECWWKVSLLLLNDGVYHAYLVQCGDCPNVQCNESWLGIHIDRSCLCGAAWRRDSSHARRHEMATGTGREEEIES